MPTVAAIGARSGSATFRKVCRERTHQDFPGHGDHRDQQAHRERSGVSPASQTVSEMANSMIWFRKPRYRWSHTAVSGGSSSPLSGPLARITRLLGGRLTGACPRLAT